MTSPLKRRQFLQLTTATALAAATRPGLLAAAEGVSPEELYRQLIPAKKSLDAAWVASLFQRAHPQDAGIRGQQPEDLARIGMTVGGIGCGTVYLSGDGQLYVWDIFHRPHEGVVPQQVPVPAGLETLGGHKKVVRERDGSSYLNPPSPKTFANPFRQEFLLEIEGEAKPRPMRQEGWQKVAFTGRWPLGIVEFSDPGCPMVAKLESWTPFIPLNTADSSLPVTVMEYTLTNSGKAPVKGKLTGIWENPVLIHTRKHADPKEQIITTVEEGMPDGKLTLLSFRADPGKQQCSDWGSATLACLDEAKADGQSESISRSFQLAAGATLTIRFLLCWHFPRIPKLGPFKDQTPQYAKRFADADAVARHVVGRFEELRRSTMAWVSTWNDSTLPQWVLDRSILTTNTLQTTTCEILAGDAWPEGRFWAWEGIGCCPGTCAHVWHYAQGVARLFPSLERNLREVSDFQIGMNPDGSIRFRAESAKTVAIDAQTGIILRTWREHLIDGDGSFLKRVWPQAKKALEWLIEFDGKDRDGLDGLIDGEQHNTLDAEWYGKVHCLCSLYLGALRAGEEMAKAMKDDAFAARCAEIHRSGAQKIGTLFNGEFYIQQEDPTKLDKIGVGSGCYIDQVIGQWWAHQVGLGRIYDATQIRKALASLWKYNFVPHIGRFREGFNRGRFYALGDEAGLVMCTWPKGGLRDDFTKHWQYGYFNECMTGFEWQVAAHLIQEGDAIDAVENASSLLDDDDNAKASTLRGLAISRAIHDRYAPSRRNPYNEVECSDHYARANASYSVFLALCGFHYDGPAGIIGFAPKLIPTRFKAAYTAAEGWGSFEQEQRDGVWRATLRVSHGKLRLRGLLLPWIEPGVRITLGNRNPEVFGTHGSARWSEEIILEAGGPALDIVSR